MASRSPLRGWGLVTYSRPLRTGLLDPELGTILAAGRAKQPLGARQGTAAAVTSGWSVSLGWGTRRQGCKKRTYADCFSVVSRATWSLSSPTERAVDT